MQTSALPLQKVREKSINFTKKVGRNNKKVRRKSKTAGRKTPGTEQEPSRNRAGTKQEPSRNLHALFPAEFYCPVDIVEERLCALEDIQYLVCIQSGVIVGS